MRRAATAVVVAVFVCLAACGGSQRGAGQVGADDGIILVQCDVGDAEVWVNERRIGFVADLDGGIALSPGRHRLELRHDRYHTHYRLLDVAPDDRVTLDIELAEAFD